MIGIFELLSNDNHKEDEDELIKLSGEVIKDLNEELLLQENVMAAESGDLEVKAKEIRTTEVIEESIKQVIQYPESKNIQIIQTQDTIEETLVTDPTILKRILINMLKNAVEASKTDQNVHIGCYNNDENIVFWVHNYAYIPESSQIQIFERTFSTKGEDRGLGTYSIKLLGEKYLGGKAYFTSNIEEGTTFYFELPKNKK